jgi:ribonucleoside-diphosphate reductase beta chain
MEKRMAVKLKPKKVFNQDSNEDFGEAKILGGNPNGIFNFNKTNHSWATELYDKMEARTWFRKQVNVGKDKNNYPKLSPSEKRTYDLVLSQLIANDSIQTNQLMDRINCYITSPIVNACLSRQACEESVHSGSYAIMAEDIAQDTDRIYNMHKFIPELAEKNKAVESLYETLTSVGQLDINVEIPEVTELITQSHSNDVINKDNLIKMVKEATIRYCNNTDRNPTDEDMLLAFGANQILEELVFPGGFVALLSLGTKMPGSAEMITEIMKDETLSHVQLFKHIFRTTVQESFEGKIPVHIQNRLKQMIISMVDAEKKWTKFATHNLIGFSDRTIDIFIEAQANSVCNNLGLMPIFEKHKENPLKKILVKNLKGGEDTESRESFFEVNVASYSKGSVEVDF